MEELPTPEQSPRQTKIVATLGPASTNELVLGAMLDAGVDVVRVNMSHGAHAEHAKRVRLVRDLAEARGRPLAVLLDLQGPKIRTGPLVGGRQVTLQTGGELVITTDPIGGTAERVSTTYAGLPEDVRPGDHVLLDDGAIELRVRAVAATAIRCDILHGGTLGEHKGINLPGVAIRAPAFTAKDERDLRFGFALGVDYVALSFVRRPEDAAPVRSAMRAAGHTAPLIAKLEKPEAIAHLDAILQAFDGAMVARGDLGVEMALERVPMLQKRVLRRAHDFGKVTITATQMLASMTSHPRPTRAEVSDVANAICDGTDALMLSGETAIGAYPVEAVAMMDRIARQVEGEQPDLIAPSTPRRSLAQATARAANTLAEEAGAVALVILARDWRASAMAASWRPAAPAYAYADDVATFRRLALWRGVTPVLLSSGLDGDRLLAAASADLLARGAALPGDCVVVVGSPPHRRADVPAAIALHTIGSPEPDGAPPS